MKMRSRIECISCLQQQWSSGFEGQGDRNGQSKPLNSEARVEAI